MQMDEKIINEEVTETEEAKVEEISTEEAKAEPEQEEVGKIKISLDVVSTIAGIAAAETKGVAGMYTSFADGLAGKFGAKKNQNKGVKVEMNNGVINVDLYIVVSYGVRIPELAWEIQETVKNNIETMTGLSVEKVNIHIEGVSFAKTEPSTEIVKEEAKDN